MARLWPAACTRTRRRRRHRSPPIERASLPRRFVDRGAAWRSLNPEDPLMRSSRMATLLRRPGFARYSATVAAVRATGTMFNVAGVLLVTQRPHNLALAGTVVAAGSLPGAITGPFLGGWLDVTRSRRRLLVLDRLVTAIRLAAVLLLAGHAPNWLLPLAALLYGISSPLSAGAFSAVLPEVAGPELLGVANSLEAASYNLAFIVGPALAGAIGGAGGPRTGGCGRRTWCELADRAGAVDRDHRLLLRVCVGNALHRFPRLRRKHRGRRSHLWIYVGGHLLWFDGRRAGAQPSRALDAAVDGRGLHRDGRFGRGLAPRRQPVGGAPADLFDRPL